MLQLKEMRKKAGLTMREVALQLHCSGNTVWRWEAERQSPSLDTIRRMAVIYGCTIDDLFGGSNPTEAAEVEK